MKRAAVVLLSVFSSSLAFAQSQPISLPALDEGGLIALIALIGIVGGIVARRKK